MVLFYLILGAALLYLIYLVLNWFRQADPHQVARAVKLSFLGGLGFVLLSLLLTGRLALFLGGCLILIPFIPRLLRFLKGEEGWPRGQAILPPENPLSEEEARDILGVSETATREEILAAYRAQMRAVHPDRGGSTGLAQRVNQAKDKLLAPFEKTRVEDAPFDDHQQDD